MQTGRLHLSHHCHAVLVTPVHRVLKVSGGWWMGGRWVVDRWWIGGGWMVDGWWMGADGLLGDLWRKYAGWMGGKRVGMDCGNDK